MISSNGKVPSKFKKGILKAYYLNLTLLLIQCGGTTFYLNLTCLT